MKKTKDFKKAMATIHDRQKSARVSVKDRINNLLAGSKNINTLITKKVEDYVLIEEEPIPIRVGDRTIFIGNMTYENEHLFFQRWAEIIAALSAKTLNMEISAERRADLLKKGDFHLLANADHMMEFLMMDRWLFDHLVDLIDRTILRQQAYFKREGIRSKIRWKNCSKRYFAKHITKEKLIQICYLTYFYNFEAVKKNTSILINRMNMQSLSGTFMYFWLQNLDGLTGKFAGLQAPSVDYAFRDSPKTTDRPRPGGKSEAKKKS
jgi:hypothetical protein